MIYVLIGLSLLFIAIGFILTENNAKYLMSGYNTMDEEDRKKVDVKRFIPFFKKFHFFLGASFLVLGLALTYFINENASGIFLAVYPISAYIYFIIASSRYSKGLSTKGNRAGVIILIGILVFVIGLMGYGFKENELSFDTRKIEFEGAYGETLTPSEIESVDLVNHPPKIKLKSNGFAMGTINKGYFKTESGETIKLILNSDNKPYILFTKSNGQKIYYSAKEKSNEKIVNEKNFV